MCFSYLNSEEHLTFTNILFALALSVKKIVYQQLKFQNFFKFKVFLNISASICQVLFNNFSFCLFVFCFTHAMLLNFFSNFHAHKCFLVNFVSTNFFLL